MGPFMEPLHVALKSPQPR